MTNEQRRIIQALCWGAPFCLASKFDDLGHCIEASVCGARALQALGIDARPAQCYLIAGSDAHGIVLAVGITPRQAFEMAATDEMSFEEWLAASRPEGTASHPAPIHVVILADVGSDRVLVDLTFGQVRTGQSKAAALPATMTAAAYGGTEWIAQAEHESFRIQYGPPMHDPETISRGEKLMADFSARANAKTLEEDMVYFARLALGCGDGALFMGEVIHRHPALFEKTMEMF